MEPIKLAIQSAIFFAAAHTHNGINFKQFVRIKLNLIMNFMGLPAVAAEIVV